MINSVSIALMETMSMVCPHACLKTTVVLSSNVTLRWKCEFFNYLSLL
jgi:hypothetical protein